jgi:predicted AAA+ superfamily ATPase
MHPLTVLELGNDFNLHEVLRWGALPAVWSRFKEINERTQFLKSYVANYIRQEVMDEQIIRKIEPFLHFLEIAAQCNGKIINYSKVARDSGNNAKNIERYYEILKDTLVGFELPAFHLSIRKRQSQKSKFFLFDLGVKNAMDGTISMGVNEGTSAFGHAFEHFFILECIRLNDYYGKD